MPTYNQPFKNPLVLQYNENGKKNKEWSHRPKAQAGGAHVLPLLNPRPTYNILHARSSVMDITVCSYAARMSWIVVHIQQRGGLGYVGWKGLTYFM